MAETHSRWHIDKNVPLALIIAIIIQSGAGIWWAATVNNRVERLESDIKASAPQAERLTRVEGIKRIEQILSERPR